MNSTLQTIIRSRATPWLLLAVTLVATTIASLDPRRRGFASPELQALSDRIHGRGRDYVRGLELIVSGEPVLGDSLLASATDRMIVLAEECVRLEGCDIEIFVRALGTAIAERHLAIGEARKTRGANPIALSTVRRPFVDREPAPPVRTPTPTVPRKTPRRMDVKDVVSLNGPVKRALNDWLTWNRPQLADAFENYLFLREEIAPIYAKAQLPEALLFALMAQETGAKVHSYSSAGAAGPLQFMPTTARRYGLVHVSGFDMRLDPVASTKASAKYLTVQLGRFGNDLPKALAAYNGGESRLAALHRQLQGVSFWDAKLSDAVPIETRNYVPGVLAAAWIFMHAPDFGLVASPDVEFGTTTITLREPISLGELTICLGTEHNRSGWFRTLRNLNPRLSGNGRIDAGEQVRMPSMLVPSYVENCAGDAPLLARARELHDAMSAKQARLEYALQERDT
jgi:membrane-bound lytic murein transglycosylase D